MSFETASLFFVDEAPLAGLARLLTSLRDAQLLADLHVDAGGAALTEEPALGALFASGRCSLDAFLAALPALSSTKPAAPPRVRFFYVRMVAPEGLPVEWRTELEEKLGELPEAPGEFVHVHPFELVVAIDLADVDGERTAVALGGGTRRAHPHLPGAFGIVDEDRPRSGTPIRARTGFEIRCLPETVGVLAFVLERAGLLVGRDVLVRVLT